MKSQISVKEKSNICKIVDGSDFHLGTRWVPPVQFRDNLIEHFYPRLTPDVFMLILNGDFWHTQLTMNSEAGIYAGIIIDDILRICKQNKIYVRVLRGTFSHDRKQNQWFLLRDGGKMEINGLPLVRVFSELEWESLPFNDIQISCLYVPDNLPYTDLTEAIVEKLEALRLKKVDFMITHGYFEHLIPTGMKMPTQGLMYQNRLEPYVNGCILNGHVHAPSIYRKVVTIGSFERFAHREEEAKGFVVIDYDPVSFRWKYEFVENTNAILFLSIDLVDCIDFEEALVRIKKKLSKHPIDELALKRKSCHLRVVTDNVDLRHAAESFLKNEYPTFTVSTKNVKSQDLLEEIQMLTDSDLPIITPENLPLMIQKNCRLPLSVGEIEEVLNGTSY